jgi:hypothetical protein
MAVIPCSRALKSKALPDFLARPKGERVTNWPLDPAMVLRYFRRSIHTERFAH